MHMRVQDSGVIERYGVRDFIPFDPGGVLWRLGQDS